MFFPVRRQRLRRDPRSSRKPDRSFRPRCELLEDRTVPTTLVALDTNTQRLLFFDSANPANVFSQLPVKGLQPGDTPAEIAFSPATGGLYMLGETSQTGQSATLHLYTLNGSTGAATLVSPAAGFTASPVSGMAFDPTTNDIRVISSTGANFRVSPITGTLLSQDTPLSGGGTTTPTVSAIAYTPAVQQATATTLFGISNSTTTGSLLMIGSPNGSPNSANTGMLTTVGSLGVFGPVVNGLTIVPGTTAGTNTAYAVNDTPIILPGSASPQLFTINLATGAATTVGTISPGLNHFLVGLAAVPTATFSPPGQLPAGATAGERFVNQVFFDLLGRFPSQGDLTALGGFIDQGLISRLQFVEAIELAPEYLSRVVNQDYLDILGRTADSSGLNGGVLFLEAGGSNQALRALLYGSAEYYAKVGGTNNAFLGALFQATTGQTIDANSLSILNGALNSGVSRTTLALLLLETPAAAQQQVTRFFELYLGRAPGSAELAAHATLVEAGQASLDLAFILSSQEFLNDLTT